MNSITYNNLIPIIKDFLACDDSEKLFILGYLDILHKEEIEDKPTCLLRRLLFIEKMILTNKKEADMLSYADATDRFLKNNMSFFIENIPNYGSNIDKITFPQREKDYLLNILGHFLNSVSPSLLAFYQQMVKDNAIFQINKRNISGVSHRAFTIYDIFDNNKDYIYIYYFSTMRDLSTLIHEIGHAYYNHINNHGDNSVNMEEDIKSEIPSIMLEALFIVYLRSINLHFDADLLEKKYFNIMKYCYKDLNNIDNIRYLVGLSVGLSKHHLINHLCSLEEFFNYVYNVDYKDVMTKPLVKVI